MNPETLQDTIDIMCKTVDYTSFVPGAEKSKLIEFSAVFCDDYGIAKDSVDVGLSAQLNNDGTRTLFIEVAGILAKTVTYDTQMAGVEKASLGITSAILENGGSRNWAGWVMAVATGGAYYTAGDIIATANSEIASSKAKVAAANLWGEYFTLVGEGSSAYVVDISDSTIDVPQTSDSVTTSVHLLPSSGNTLIKYDSYNTEGTKTSTTLSAYSNTGKLITQTTTQELPSKSDFITLPNVSSEPIHLEKISVTADPLTWYEELLTAGIELWEDVQDFGTELINSVEKFIGGLMDSAESQLDQQQPDYGDLSFQNTTSNGKTVAQITTATSNNTGYISTITLEGKTVLQRVSNTIAGVEIKASYVANANGELQLSSIDSINGEPPSDSYAALVALKEAGLTSDTLSNGTSDATLANSIGSAAATFDIANNSALQNLINGFSNNEIVQGVANYGPSIIDALSLVKAIQSGEPLPIVASGLRLANDISIINKNPNYVLSGSATAISGVLSIMSLDAALKRGDTLGAISAGAQTISGYFGTEVQNATRFLRIA